MTRDVAGWQRLNIVLQLLRGQCGALVRFLCFVLTKGVGVNGRQFSRPRAAVLVVFVLDAGAGRQRRAITLTAHFQIRGLLMQLHVC